MGELFAQGKRRWAAMVLEFVNEPLHLQDDGDGDGGGDCGRDGDRNDEPAQVSLSIPTVSRRG